MLNRFVDLLSNILDRKSCEHCGATPVSDKELTIIQKFFKDNGFIVDPREAGDALDDVINAKKNEAQYPDTKPPVN